MDKPKHTDRCSFCGDSMWRVRCIPSKLDVTKMICKNCIKISKEIIDRDKIKPFWGKK